MEEKKQEVKNTQEPKEISLLELFQVVWKGRWIIIISAVVGLVVAGAYGFVTNRNNLQMTTVVSLQWTGISDGEYPDGTNFNYSNAIESYVIENAIETLGLPITTSEVREATTLSPIVPANVTALIQTALENGEEISYHSTDYKITVAISDLGLDKEQGAALINEIILEFQADFDRKYITQEVILDYTGTDYTDVDYVDIHDILNTQTTLITSLMAQKYDESPEFVSKNLSVGFNDILVRAELVERIELAQIEAKTNAYLLTKDAEYLVTYYTYQIELKNFDLLELQAQETNIQTQITAYDGSTQTVIIPGSDPSTVYEIETAYNQLLNDLLTVQAEIAKVQSDIDYLELRKERYEDPSVVVSQVKQAEEIDKVNDLVDSADEKLNAIVLDANVLLSDYHEYLNSNTIKPLMSPEVQSLTSVLMIAAVGLVLGAGASGVYVLFKHDWS